LTKTFFLQVYTALVGPVVTSTTADATGYTHYSILKTIENNWGLGNLGKSDVSATAFGGLHHP
jgi:hypothetical protein